jgi:hypothetical protein
MIGFPGHPADSGVGESVGSCNLVGKESTYFTRSLEPVVVLGISRKVIMKLKNSVLLFTIDQRQMINRMILTKFFRHFFTKHFYRNGIVLIEKIRRTQQKKL